jgi:hypothetical protein
MKYKSIFLLSSICTLLPRAYSMKFEDLWKIYEGEHLNEIFTDDDNDTDDDTDEYINDLKKNYFNKINPIKNKAEFKIKMCELLMATDNAPFSTLSIDPNMLIEDCKADSPPPKKKIESNTKTETYKLSPYKSILPIYGRSSYGPSSKTSQKRTMVLGGLGFKLDDVAYDNDGPFARYMREQKSKGKAKPLSASRQPRGQVSNAQKRKGSDLLLETPSQLFTTLNELE